MACNCSGQRCACNFEVVDSPTVDLELLGSGSGADPWVLSASVVPDSVGPYTLRSVAASVCGGDVGGGFDPLDSFVVPGGTLAANGDRLKFRTTLLMSTFVFDFNGFTFTYGGTVIFTHPAVSTLDTAVEIEGEIIRTGAAASKASVFAKFVDGGGGVSTIEAMIVAVPANNAAANTFLVTGGNVGGSPPSQVCLETHTIDVFPI